MARCRGGTYLIRVGYDRDREWVWPGWNVGNWLVTDWEREFRIAFGNALYVSYLIIILLFALLIPTL